MSRFDSHSHSSPLIRRVSQILKLCPTLLSFSATKRCIMISTHRSQGYFLPDCDAWHQVGPRQMSEKRR